MSCCGTMEQFRATEGALNILNFKKTNSNDQESLQSNSTSNKRHKMEKCTPKKTNAVKFFFRLRSNISAISFIKTSSPSIDQRIPKLSFNLV